MKSRNAKYFFIPPYYGEIDILFVEGGGASRSCQRAFTELRRRDSARITAMMSALARRVGLQLKRVNAAALYLRPGLVELADYITARGNPSILGERHLSPANALCSLVREKLPLSLKADCR